MSEEEVYLTPNELAARWKTSVAYLANRRSDNRGLPYTKLYGRVMYALEDVLAYEKKRECRME